MTHVVNDTSSGISRRSLLSNAGRGAVGLTLGTTLTQLLTACAGNGTVEATDTLNVAYWSGVSPEEVLRSVFQDFEREHGIKVNYTPLPPVFGDTVQMLTTYLSSGYQGIDVLWLDDFMTGTFSAARWLEPLEESIPQSHFDAIAPATLKLSTYNGHRYRLPANYGNVLFYYRRDLFEQAGLNVPRTWDEIVQVGQRLTTGSRYGIGMAGKNGSTELFNEMCYWLGQAGTDPMHLTAPGARQALQFMHDMIHRYKIAPPETTSSGYSSLQAAFADNRFAMWAVWDGFLSGFEESQNLRGNIAIAPPPRGPANNSTIAANWGWSINKFSPRKDAAARFIRYATTSPSEVALAETGSTPARLADLSSPKVQEVLVQAEGLARYAEEVELRSRPITGQAQRVSEVLKIIINEYLNNQIDLDTAISQGQSGVDQALEAV